MAPQVIMDAITYRITEICTTVTIRKSFSLRRQLTGSTNEKVRMEA